MDEQKCRTCGAEWLAGMSYCRQCGSAIVADSLPGDSEQTTALLAHTDSVATQRLDPRTTAPGPVLQGPTIPARSTVVAGKHGARRRGLVLGTVVILLIIGIISAVAIVRLRGHSRTTEGTNLVYPGARTLVDMTNEGGGRFLQLETSDSLTKVEDWYQKTLKPQKVVRLTSASVVLKNENTTATIAAEGNKTNILIKKVH